MGGIKFGPFKYVLNPYPKPDAIISIPLFPCRLPYMILKLTRPKLKPTLETLIITICNSRPCVRHQAHMYVLSQDALESNFKEGYRILSPKVPIEKGQKTAQAEQDGNSIIDNNTMHVRFTQITICSHSMHSPITLHHGLNLSWEKEEVHTIFFNVSSYCHK